MAMLNRRRIQVLAVISAGFAALITVWAPWDPSHGGIRLSACIRDFDHAYDTSIFAFPEGVPPESAKALRGMSAAAVPKLLGLLCGKETSMLDDVKDWLEQKADVQWSSSRRVSDPARAIIGFSLLGEKAAPAVPELERLLGEPRYAERAIEALTLIGEPAILVMTNAIGHTNPQVRLSALHGLSSMLPPRPEALAAALRILSNDVSRNRKTAALVLSLHTNDADRVWPIFRDLVQDGDPNVRRAALHGMKNFGSRPLSLFPALANQLWTNGSATEVGAIVMGLRGMSNEPVRVVECLLEGLRSPHERHRILAARAVSDFMPAADLVLPIMKPLYLNSPTGAWRDELARTLAIIDPALVAELGLPTNRFPTVNRSLRR
jgi:hypothetical protein